MYPLGSTLWTVHRRQLIPTQLLRFIYCIEIARCFFRMAVNFRRAGRQKTTLLILKGKSPEKYF